MHIKCVLHMLTCSPRLLVQAECDGRGRHAGERRDCLDRTQLKGINSARRLNLDLYVHACMELIQGHTLCINIDRHRKVSRWHCARSSHAWASA